MHKSRSRTLRAIALAGGQVVPKNGGTSKSKAASSLPDAGLKGSKKEVHKADRSEKISSERQQSMMVDNKKKKRNAEDRERYRKRSRSMTEEEKEVRNAKERERKRKRSRSMTEEEKEEERAKSRERKRKHSRSMTEEEKEEQKAKKVSRAHDRAAQFMRNHFVSALFVQLLLTLHVITNTSVLLVKWSFSNLPATRQTSHT